MKKLVDGILFIFISIGFGVGNAIGWAAMARVLFYIHKWIGY